MTRHDMIRHGRIIVNIAQGRIWKELVMDNLNRPETWEYTVGKNSQFPGRIPPKYKPDALSLC